MTLSFIVPVRNDAGRLRRCLETIRTQSGADVEIVVADNGSTDTSPEVARALGARVVSLPGLRVSALRNRAAAAAAADLLAFVDADHELGAGWIAAARDAMRDPGVGAAGAIYTSPASGTWTQRMFGVLRGRTIGRADTPWLGSGNLVVRRDAFLEIGGFDETLETCEDVDFCQRLRASGRRLVGDERLVSVHTGDPRTLRELFVSERWRGRDNLRVSFRLRPTLRDVPSIVIPIVTAGAYVAGAVAAAAAIVAGARTVPVLAACAAIVAACAALRAARMIAAGRLRSPLDWIRAVAVALAYDGGRAASLVLPAGHRRSRPAPADLATDVTS
jgi:hypothetical protein